MAYHFVGISGSLRKASRNTGLLRCAAKQAPDGVIFSFANLHDVPFYNADIEEKPLPVEALIDMVSRADALVLACPEYNYSMSPVLKNALDWLSREPENHPLNGKPVAIMGAGAGMGSSRAQYHLRQSCVYLNLLPLNQPEIFSNAFLSCFDEDGNVADDELAAKVRDQMIALTARCEQLRKS